MIKPMILRIALPTPLRRLFDYRAPPSTDATHFIPGVRVRVPFQSRQLVGVVVELADQSDLSAEKLKMIDEFLDIKPIVSEDVLKLCKWAANYYHYPLGEILFSALPTLLRKGKPLATLFKFLTNDNHSIPPPLNDYQAKAVHAICASQNTFRVFLLDGVTGSGKTEVYLRAIQAFLKRDQQTLVLVPEISLTPQTISRFRLRFNVPIAALHSSLSEKERLHAWCAAKTGDAKIVIGTRSAIFTPFANLGLIIVDEEHDASFKQHERFRYHARDLAVMRASDNQIPIVLGSATPSLETLHNVKRKRYEYLSLPYRAGIAALPEFQIAATRQHQALSPLLIQSMKIHLQQGNQVLLFLNRRGYAPVLFCKQCGWTAGCRRCDARLIYHHSPARLQCHHCDARSVIPIRCEACKNETLEPIGYGTQRLEQTLAKNFPAIPIIRVDRDSTRKKGEMQNLLNRIHTETNAILLGTQMLAKGHHFPHVTLVGIVDVDSSLFSVDFRASEQMGQLLLQVAGRAGREEKPGTVIIQTRYPDHPLLQTLIKQGYAYFANEILTEREKTALPPFTYLALFRAESRLEETAKQFLQSIKDLSIAFSHTLVLGPVPSLLTKKKGLYGMQLLLKTHHRSELQHFLNQTLPQVEKLPLYSQVRWTLDVDPVGVTS